MRLVVLPICLHNLHFVIILKNVNYAANMLKTEEIISEKNKNTLDF